MRFLSTLIASTIGTLLALGVLFLFGMLFLFVLAASTGQAPSVRTGSVLVMDLSGPIVERAVEDPLAQLFAGEALYDLHDVKLALRKAAVDDRIEGVLLRTRGVTAPWATLEEIRRELMAFKESGKPLLASSGEYFVGEQDYFLASTADSIFATPQGLLEFNGFSLQVVFIKNLLDRLAIEPKVVRAGNFKSAVEPVLREDLSPENEEQLSALLQTQNRVFMQAVAESRGLTVEQLERIASEVAPISAESAFEAGLLDGLLYEDEVLARLKERLGYEADEDLRDISLEAYARVSPSDAGLEVNEEGEIAVVYAEGAIVPGGDDDFEFADAANEIGSETFGRAMREARESENIDAVVVRVNSPGGSASASEAMWREIALTREEKPVVVSMGGVAASGGYWIATAADVIVADPLTLTGSIGVFFLGFDLGGFLSEELGITTDAVTTSPYADLFSSTESFTEQEQALVERFVDDTYEAFLQKVADARDLSVDSVRALAGGRVWTGVQAQEIGLVDELGGLERAVQIAAERAELGEGPYRVRMLPRQRTFVEQFTRSLEARAARAWMTWGTSPAEIALRDQFRAVQRLARMQGLQAVLPLEITIR